MYIVQVRNDWAMHVRATTCSHERHQAFSSERCYLRDTKIFPWEMFLWGMLGERCKNIPLRDVTLRDVIWELQKYSFETCSFERTRDAFWKIPPELFFLEKCINIRTRQVFVWGLLDDKRILWNASKANPQSKFYMSNMKMEFLIVDTQRNCLSTLSK